MVSRCRTPNDDAGRAARYFCFFLVEMGILIGLVLAPSVYADTDLPPLDYLHGFGTKAYNVVPLTWAVLITSIVITGIVTALVVIGIALRLNAWHLPRDGRAAIHRGGRGVLAIFVGLGLSILVLIGTFIWTLLTLQSTAGPHSPAAMTIEITGKQWFWQARYISSDPSKIFTTANEIHIPVGQTVTFALTSVDVIHSFWVPALGGKMDAIPGRTNVTWLEASKPGRYRGQCSEYCGWQHAQMGFYIVAESPQSFAYWRQSQLQPAQLTLDSKGLSGERTFIFMCGSCHTVRGTGARGVVAPDLSHLMSRQTIAAATLPNTVANLSGWIEDPQDVKPGNNMPVLYISGPELEDLRSFLLSLR